LSLEHSNLLEYTTSEKFDLIVSNPPYYTSQMFSPNANRTLARHELNLPLIALLKWSKEHLSVDGKLTLIVPKEREELLLEEAINVGISLVDRIVVYGKPNTHSKTILSFSLNSTIPLTLSSFTIRNNKGEYTDLYKKYTVDFHYNKL
jgi:tRNA1Val (adenine37-N6)-methyltransferase